MVLLVERAGVATVDHLLPEGYRTVGVRLDVRHLAPTPIGFEATATVELIEVDRRRLVFRAQVVDRPFGGTQGEAELVGEGIHERAIVNVQRFAERVAEKAQ
jgi:predicted thioesterase